MSRINRVPGIGSGSFRSMQRFAEKNQIDFELLLKQAGIVLYLDSPDLSIGQEEQLMKALVAKTPCAFSAGVRVGLSYEAVDMGMLGIATLTCHTLEDALDLCARYFAKAFHFTALELKQEPTGVCIYLTPIKGASALLSEFLIGRDIGVFSALLKQIVGNKPTELIEMGFALPFRSAMHHIGHLFGMNVRFQQNHNYILFETTLLKTVMPMSNQASCMVLEQAMESHLSQMDQSGMLPVLERLLKADLSNMPSMESVAQKLNMSSRTLGRQIEKEGTSWRRLMTDIKLSSACDLLRNSHKSLRTIAQETGFSSASSLCHSFVREKGCTPNQYREQPIIKRTVSKSQLQYEIA